MNIGYLAVGEIKKEFMFDDKGDAGIAKALANNHEVYAFSQEQTDGDFVYEAYSVSRGKRVTVRKQMNDFLDVLFIAGFRKPNENRDEVYDFMRVMDNIDIPVINPPDNFFSLDDKKYLFRLQEKGIPFPKTELVSSKDGLINLISSATQEHKIIVKPVRGQGGKGIERFPGGDEELILSFLQEQKEVFVQTYIPEIVNGEINVICFDYDIKYAIKKVPKDFLSNWAHASRVEETELNEDDKEFVMNILSSEEFLPKVTRVDFVRTYASPFLMEISANRPALYSTVINGGPVRVAKYLEDLLKREVFR